MLADLSSFFKFKIYTKRVEWNTKGLKVRTSINEKQMNSKNLAFNFDGYKNDKFYNFIIYYFYII